MSNPDSNDGLGTSHKSSAHLVSKSQTTQHPNDTDEVYNSLTPHTQQQDNQAYGTTADTIVVYDNTPAAAVSPTDTKQVIATHGGGRRGASLEQNGNGMKERTVK